MGLAKKILLSFALISLICVAVASIVSFLISKESLIKQTNEQMRALTTLLKDRVNGELHRARNMSERLGAERLMEGLFLAYEGAFYGGNFSAGKDLDINSIPYKNLDERYGKRVRNLAEDYGVERILLASIDAQIIFSSLEDPSSKILGRNLKGGNLQKSGLSSCYERAMSSEKAQIIYSGVEYYEVLGTVGGFFCIRQLAEFDHPAEGISKGDVMGVVITQINFVHLNKIVARREGIGETGQSYIVGDDLLLRSDIALGGAEYSLNESIKNKRKVETEAVKLALEGQSGQIKSINSIGESVFSSYEPINAFGQKWALISEKSVKEVYSPALRILYYIGGASLLTLIAVLILGYSLSFKLTLPINEAGDELARVSSIVGENSNSMKENSSRLSESSGKVAAAIQETVSVLDELTSMVNRNLENVEASSERSDESQEMARKGDQSVKSMLEAMDDINHSNEKMILEMSSIGESMQEIITIIENIGEKASVINDIVFQTKLLSFNASVEAARAGEQGKGFAVVAEEVGSLASASGKAAGEISELLNNSVLKVNDIVEMSKNKLAAMTKIGHEKIILGNERAQECGKYLQRILENICDVDRKIKEIKDASQEQSTGINEVSLAMEELERISHTTSEVSIQALANAQGLEEQSASLDKIMINLARLVNGAGPGSSLEFSKIKLEKKVKIDLAERNEDLDQANIIPLQRENVNPPDSADPRFKEI